MERKFLQKHMVVYNTGDNGRTIVKKYPTTIFKEWSYWTLEKEIQHNNKVNTMVYNAKIHFVDKFVPVYTYVGVDNE